LKRSSIESFAIARDDHDFAGRLFDGVIEPGRRSMAAKFEVEVGEPGKTLYVIGHGGFLEFFWGFSITTMMMAVAIDANGSIHRSSRFDSLAWRAKTEVELAENNREIRESEFEQASAYAREAGWNFNRIFRFRCNCAGNRKGAVFGSK
jgi:hypothetical protein